MAQYELNLRDYWQIILKRRLVVVLVFFAVLIPTVIYTGLQRPVYQAESSVQWKERRTVIGLLTELVSDYGQGDPMVAQAQIIQSLPVMEKVIIELGMVSKDTGADEITQQASFFQGELETDIVKESNVIRIIVRDENPEVASRIANKVAEVYIAENLREKSKQSRSVREFVERQLKEISAKLKSSEEELARFKEVEVPTGVGLALQDRLAVLEAEHQKLLRQYTEKYPDTKNIEEEINRLKEQLRALPQKELEYNRLSREVEINAKLYNDLKEKLEAARISEAENVEDVSQVDRAAVPGSPVAPNKSLNYLAGTLLGVLLGLTGAFLVEQLDTSIGTIEDVENYLKLPVLGVIPYLKTEDDKKVTLLQKLWPHEVKGKEKVSRLRKQLLINYSSSSPIFEAYRILRTGIQNEIFKGKIKGNVLLFSSSGPEEGKSITISNLAIVMAQGGLRTLLIDADLRRSQVHNIFGLKNDLGLFNLLSQAMQLKDAIKTFTDILVGEKGFDETFLKIPGLDNLNILTSGSLSTTPAELLASNEMNILLKELKDKYDLILIDSPPVMAVADAAILAPKSDGIILVYRVGKTARSVLFRAKTQLEETGAQVKGIVLNNMSPEMELRYGYYYNYKYYGKYYTSGKEETKGPKG
jgi:capsular exopolysaccharide synthesis family protein